MALKMGLEGGGDLLVVGWRFISIFGFAVIAALIAVGAAFPVDAQRGTDTIRVLILKDFPPQFVSTPRGPSGLAVEIMREVARRVSLNIEFVTVASWKDVYLPLKNGTVDVLANMGISEARREFVEFTLPYEVFDIKLFVRTETTDIHSLDGLGGRVLGVQATNVLTKGLMGSGKYRIKTYPSFRAALLGLLSGEIDALPAPTEPFLRIARAARLDHRIQPAGPSLLEVKRAMAVPKGRIALRDRLNKGLGEFKRTGAYRALLTKWYGKPAPFWTPLRIALSMAALLAACFLINGIWRYYSILRLNRRLRASENNFRDLIEGSIQGVYILDPERRLLFANQACADMFGYDSPVDILALGTPSALIAPHDRDRLAQYIQARLGGETVPSRYDYDGVRKDGAIIRIQAISRRIVWRERDAIQMTLINITERQRAEAALQESEDRIRAILDTSPAAFTLKDRGGRYLLVSRVFAEWAGFDPSELIGKTPAAVFPPEQAEQIDSTDRKVMETGEKFNYEGLRSFRHDRTRTVVTYKAPIYAADGGVAAVSSFILDITERRQAETALRESEIRLRAILDSSPTAFSLKDKEGRILFMNRTFGQWFGIDPAEMVGMTVHDLYSPEQAEQIISNDRRVLETSESLTAEVVLSYAGHPDRTLMVYKAPVFADDGSIIAVSSFNIDITERKKADEALAESEERFRSAFESVAIGNIVIGQTGIVEAFNAVAEVIFGYAAREVVGKNIKMLMPDADASGHDSYLENYLRTGEAKIIGVGREVTGLRKNGEEFPMQLDVGEMNIGGGRSFIGSLTDLSELKSLESQLLHAQRMEAVGQLTGGVAHDFNNLLAAMLGNAELLGNRIAGDEKSLRHVERIKTAVRRGASLTYRLLAFSRKQTLSPRATDIERLIGGLDDMLRRTLSETIDVKIAVNTGLWPSMIDPSQLEHVLINLAVNARDAMPDGGVLTIEVDNATLDETYTDQHQGLAPGDYVKISVSDNGTGMTPEIREKVFEPFFTTKDVGAGSGLGLSMVYGFAKQSGGHVSIYSEIGEGTSVNIYLPRSREDAAQIDAEIETRETPRGSERILVVEDDEGVREIPASYLRQQGYEIAEAANGKTAIGLLQDGRPYDLLFTDMVLPGGMNGAAIAKKARRIQPGIKILYTTGYADNAVIHNGLLDQTDTVIRKPYELTALAEMVRSILDKADE